VPCIACSAELPPTAGFCHVCGAPQRAHACASCAAELVPGAAFCSVCGTATAGEPVFAAAVAARPPVAAASERRLTSVLFADLVSYTTFSEQRDTEEVRDLLTQYFDVCSTVVKRYGGTVEKFIGDAVMAVWGVPSAHEDDAERAVRAGLELIAGVTTLGETLGLPQLALRAGVVTGEVSATVGATDQGMVAGDPVNTAARIQSAATAGELWVDANTRAMTAAAVTYTDAGEHLLKGKVEPVRLYRAGTVVASVGGSQRVDGLEAPLAGRDRELRLLKELFHATEESDRPRLVVLDGEAGVGKSRLGWEFEKYISGVQTEVAWHRGRCLSYGEGVSYWALTEAVRTRLGLLDEDAAAVVSENLGRVLAEIVPDAEERAWLQPRLASLMGEEAGDFLREDLFSAWTRFFERVGDDSDAVVLVIDDAQYADVGLLDFLEHLLANARTAIFVLLLARPELLETRPQLGGRRASVIRLEPLSAAAMGTLVDGLVDGLPASTREGLVARSEGIPLFAVETVRALIDQELVRPFEGRYVVTSGEDVDLSAMAAPASLHALVAARLDGLTADERRVVNDASVLGAAFTRERIAILCSDISDLDAVLAGLARKEILATDTDRFSAERGQYRFVQTVVRQVAYSTLARRDRKARHLAVADHLAGQSDRVDEVALVIAQHLLDAVEASTGEDRDVEALQQRAAELLVVAGDRACALGAYADGLRVFEAALEHLTGDLARGVVLEKAASAALPIGRDSEVIELASSAMTLFDAAGEPVLAGRVAAVYARACVLRGDSRSAVRIARERYTALDGTPGAERARTALGTVLCRALLARGEHAEAAVAAAESLYLAEQVGEPLELAAAMQNLVVQQFAHGSTRVGRAVLHELVEFTREHQLWRELMNSEVNLGLIMSATSLRSGIEHQRAALATARDHGLAQWPCWTNLSTALWRAGEWDSLDEILRDCSESEVTLDPGTAVILATVDAWRAEAGLQPWIADTEPGTGDDMNWLAWHELLLALRATADDDDVSGVAHARQAVTHVLSDAQLQDDFVNIWPTAVRLALAAGDNVVAADLVELVADAQPGLVSIPVRAHLQVLRGLLGVQTDRDPVAVEADLRAGIAALGEYGAVPARARAEEDLGSWLIGQGRNADAQPLLDAARSTYASLGATAWLARLEGRLGALR
jgi:class 3 adenylate cyclase